MDDGVVKFAERSRIKQALQHESVADFHKRHGVRQPVLPVGDEQERFGDWNSEDAVLKSIKYCEEWREKCLLEKKSLIFETVLSADDKINYIERAMAAGFFVRLFFVCTASPAINASRIANRVMNGGHDVPISKIISRYQKSISNCRYIAKKVNRVYLYDNTAENTEATLLIRFADGNVAKRYVQTLPEWAEQIVEE